MRIIARKTLTQFIASLAGHADHEAVKASLEAWYQEALKAKWQSPMELKSQYRSASIVGDRVIFNIKGNSYRLIVAIDYGRQVVFIKWVGSHREYDQIDVRTVQHGD